MAKVVESDSGSGGSNVLSLDSIRESLIRQEDSIVFSLIERAKFPLNSPAFEESRCVDSGNSSSLTEFFVREIEILQAKVGRYENPEENPFFLENIPHSVFPTHKYPLNCSLCLSNLVMMVTIHQLLLMISRVYKIHYGKFVAEVKLRDAPQDYEPVIHAKDRDGLMKLLTFEKVEEMVQKKAETFGQEVKCINGDENEKKYKVNPLLVSRIYGEWLIPLTKLVEVEYLLRRLD